MGKKKEKDLVKDAAKLTVQKSKPLFALWQSELSLAEFKILDIYLGRINSHDDTHRTVKFEKGELEEILGLKQIKPQVLDDRLKNLMTTVRLPDEDDRRGFTRISLFEKAHAMQDDSGIWEVELTCTETAKKYIFNIEEINYLRYKLKNIINIKSRYSYIMFLYLWENKYRGTWELSLEQLKVLLHCEKEETYKQFKRLNDLVLKKVHKEIHAVTDIQYDYETIKKGRSVVAIRFIYKSKSLEEVIEQEEQFTLDIVEEDIRDPNRELWEDAIQLFHFSKEQIEEIKSLLITIPDFRLPESPACYGAIDLRMYHYMDQKAKQIIRRDRENPIRSKFRYLRKLLLEDAILCV